MPDDGIGKPSLALDALFAAVLASLTVAHLRAGVKLGPLEPGPAAVLTGVYIQSWGLLFLASYFFPSASYLLKGIMWCCENAGRLRGRWTAILWGLFAIALGSVAVAQGLGWLRM
jgi:hypothetical protein